MTETIREQATRGFRWTAGAHGARQVIQIATLVVLTRLLDPDDFGLMSMAVVFSGFAQLFQDLGIGSAIIQKQNASRVLISSLFWVTMIAGVVLAGLLVALAPLVSMFYDEPRVTPLLQFIAASFVLSAPGVVPKALLRRDLAFDRIARGETLAVILGAVAAIVGASFGAGPFALAMQTMVFGFVTTVMFWRASEWMPRFEFSRVELKSVMGFSAALTGFNISNHFMRHADYLIIGKLAGVEALGFYTVAYQLMLYPLRHISNVITRVAYPVYAKLQDAPIRLRQAFCRTSANIVMLTFPLMVGMALVADPLVVTMFGAEWKPAAVLLVLLAPVGLAQSLITTFGAIYKVTARTGLFFVWSLFVGVLSISGFLIGVRWGATGVATSYLIVTCVIAVPSMVVPFRLIDLSVARYLSQLWRSALCAGIMGLVVFVLREMLGGRVEAPVKLALVVPTGVLTYGVLTAMVNRARIHELLEVVRPRRRAVTG